ncbi:MAG: alpha/beta hydrolase family protein [Acidobacteria bacterium]|nr:alpha/beta hydrolase family protein [Acidobacteriota bacterium]
MLGKFIHRRERYLSSVDTNRVVRPFEWGAEFLDLAPIPGETEDARVSRFVARALEDSDAYFATPALEDAEFDGERLRFSSALSTRWEVNNTVTARYIPSRRPSKKAVIVLPQWNADSESHVALGQIFARFGISALRLSLPYHDVRMPEELQRADYMVSGNVGRTLQACRQAVMDVRRCVDWLERRGYTQIGITGTSIGSCIAFLAYVHEPRLRVGVFNHVSSFFADVVWTGISTRHVRAGIEQRIDLETLRDAWMPISPNAFIHRLKHERPHRPRLMITARYDLTFLPHLSERAFAEFRHHEIPVDRATLRCGHYTSGRFPFKFQLGYLITKYLHRHLAEA